MKRKKQKSLPETLAQALKKSLRYIVKKPCGVYVFSDYIGVCLSEEDYMKFAVKWGSYNGNTLPPMAMEPGDSYVWNTYNSWSRTREGFSIDHLITVTENATPVMVTNFLFQADKAGEGDRLVRFADGSFGLVDDAFISLVNLVEGEQLLHCANHRYSKVNSEGHVTAIFMGKKHDTLQSIMAEQLGLTIAANA